MPIDPQNQFHYPIKKWKKEQNHKFNLDENKNPKQHQERGKKNQFPKKRRFLFYFFHFFFVNARINSIKFKFGFFSRFVWKIEIS